MHSHLIWQRALKNHHHNSSVHAKVDGANELWRHCWKHDKVKPSLTPQTQKLSNASSNLHGHWLLSWSFTRQRRSNIHSVSNTPNTIARIGGFPDFYALPHTATPSFNINTCLGIQTDTQVTRQWNGMKMSLLDLDLPCTKSKAYFLLGYTHNNNMRKCFL